MIHRLIPGPKNKIRLRSKVSHGFHCRLDKRPRWIALIIAEQSYTQDQLNNDFFIKILMKLKYNIGFVFLWLTQNFNKCIARLLRCCVVRIVMYVGQLPKVS